MTQDGDVGAHSGDRVSSLNTKPTREVSNLAKLLSSVHHAIAR